MTIERFTALAVLASILVPAALAADDRAASQAKYAELAAKVRAGDLGVDWKALRVAAAIGEVGDPSQDFLRVKAGYGALNENKFQDALKAAREIEEHNIADVDAHYIAWRSLTELSNQNEAEKERLILAAIFNSITDSGDGKTAKTAWFAATIREEYMYMGSILNVQFVDHRTSMQDGHYYDVVAVKDKDGKELILWFDGDTEMHRQMAAGERAIHK
ncbi:DUF4919 domain-containing protein [Acidicapsa dinghuensis]|uniref:DUF4919 domain-containing protein n=1 Tax=Acidicapsa dinghuensis TaxID=2218256 RepID=A0ABW1EHV7_9BACT|nr:DUF4919 domain-containing protein [Acidicapsa dinghuensis]